MSTKTGKRVKLTVEIGPELHQAVRIKTAVSGKPATEVMREALRSWAQNGAGEEPKQAKE